DLTTGLTIEAWVRPTSTTGRRSILMKESSSGESYALYAADGSAGGGRPVATIRRTTDVAAMGTSALPLNTWTHVAATYDGATLRIFVNGAQTGATAVTGSIVTSASPLRIGGNAPFGDYFGGLIDEVRIYNRALTASEI